MPVRRNFKKHGYLFRHARYLFSVPGQELSPVQTVHRYYETSSKEELLEYYPLRAMYLSIGMDQEWPRRYVRSRTSAATE